MVPFVYGGGRNIVNWLHESFLAQNIDSEVIWLPQSEDSSNVIEQMADFRTLDFSFADQVITIRPQSHAIKHERKKIWLIHQNRGYYDLWNTSHSIVPNNSKHRKIRSELIKLDTEYLTEAKKIFVNSKNMQKRLLKFNQIQSEVLYPHLPSHLREFNDSVNTEDNSTLVYISRIEHFKRQHLILESFRYVQSNSKLILGGQLINPGYGKYLKYLIWRWNLQGRVQFIPSFIPESEKNELIQNSMALVYIPFDEDSYGYPSLEASLHGKPILTTSDSGGVLEYVDHLKNGYISKPDPKDLAKWIDYIRFNCSINRSLGELNRHTPAKLNISWEKVVRSLIT
jgi:glycosyltransferase involved in cell wall biosynthesis